MKKAKPLFIAYYQNEEAPEKYHLKMHGQDDEHFTFHLGTKSKIADIHLTHEQFPIGDPARHETLFKFQHEKVAEIAEHSESIRRTMMLFLSKRRVPLRLLKKKNLWLLPFGSDADWLIEKSKIEGKTKKHRFFPQHSFEVDFFENLLCPCALKTSEKRLFMAFSIQKGRLIEKGIVIAIVVPNGRKAFFWFRPMSLIARFKKEFSFLFEPKSLTTTTH